MARYVKASVDDVLSDEQEEVLTGITCGMDEDSQVMIDLWGRYKGEVSTMIR